LYKCDNYGNLELYLFLIFKEGRSTKVKKAINDAKVSNELLRNTPASWTFGKVSKWVDLNLTEDLKNKLTAYLQDGNEFLTDAKASGK